MDIKQEETETKGRFFIEENGRQLAEMTYSKAGNERIIIDHTEVSDELRGKGVGVKLVEQAVAMAREKKIKILPLCPFARAVFNKRQDLRDVF